MFVTARPSWVCEPLRLTPKQEYRCVCALAAFDERCRLLKRGMDLETVLALTWTFADFAATDGSSTDNVVGELIV